MERCAAGTRAQSKLMHARLEAPSSDLYDLILWSIVSQIDGHRYFTCKPGQGLIVPASRVTWHGHSVAKVLKKEKFNLASPEDVRQAVTLAKREGIAKQWD